MGLLARVYFQLNKVTGLVCELAGTLAQSSVQSTKADTTERVALCRFWHKCITSSTPMKKKVYERECVSFRCVCVCVCVCVCWFVRR